MVDKSLENAKILTIGKIINNAFKDYRINAKDNHRLALALDMFIGHLERGETPTRSEFIYLINKAMDTTKSDPNADEGKFDRLQAVGQFILTTIKLPYNMGEFLITLLREFQEEFIGSERRHFHYRDAHWHSYIDRIFSSFEFIEPTTVYPTDKKKRFKNKTDKISFRKAEDVL
jgi:hypothetical protein